MRIDYPLAQSTADFQIGYSTEAGWVVAGRDSLIVLEGKDVWWAVPLLEFAPEETIPGMADLNAMVPAARPFPLAELLHSAFASQSSYWAEKAAQWYPYLSDDDKHTLSAILSEVSRGKWATQRVRQFAQREARKLTC